MKIHGLSSCSSRYKCASAGVMVGKLILSPRRQSEDLVQQQRWDEAMEDGPGLAVVVWQGNAAVKDECSGGAADKLRLAFAFVLVCPKIPLDQSLEHLLWAG